MSRVDVRREQTPFQFRDRSLDDRVKGVEALLRPLLFPVILTFINQLQIDDDYAELVARGDLKYVRALRWFLTNLTEPQPIDRKTFRIFDRLKVLIALYRPEESANKQLFALLDTAKHQPQYPEGRFFRDILLSVKVMCQNFVATPVYWEFGQDVDSIISTTYAARMTRGYLVNTGALYFTTPILPDIQLRVAPPTPPTPEMQQERSQDRTATLRSRAPLQAQRRLFDDIRPTPREERPLDNRGLSSVRRALFSNLEQEPFDAPQQLRVRRALFV